MSSRRGIRGEGRQRLIGAAAVCYGKGGRGAMTINGVCSQAQASVGTVYHHFPGGLRDLEDVLYLDTLAGYQEGLLSELSRHRSAAAGVKAVVTFHLDWMASNLALAHYLLFFSASWLSAEHLAQLETMNATFAQAAAAWREPFVARGHIRRLPSVLYGAIVLGPAQQLGSEIIVKAPTEDVAAIVGRVGPVLADAAWLAVKGEEC
jgi:AcrR family transcriptional regulator